jgi:hypothetical protein
MASGKPGAVQFAEISRFYHCPPKADDVPIVSLSSATGRVNSVLSFGCITTARPEIAGNRQPIDFG